MRELIEKYWIFGIGFFAQGLFGLRVLVQWYLSEQKQQSVSPVVYWQISLIASVIFTMYGILRGDLVIVFGQFLAFIIYVRNLQLQYAWQSIPLYIRAMASVISVATAVWLASNLIMSSFVFNFFSSILLGTIGQVFLNARFVYQWYYSEKAKISMLPVGFWVITALGSILIVIYALERRDPVLLLAQGLGFAASVRNIQLHFAAK